MDTLAQINKIQDQLKKNEKELAAVKERQQKVDTKIKELNQKRRSLQMKAINKARAATRKRHILLGEVIERYMGREIDPDVFEAFLNCFGAYANYKKGDGIFYQDLPQFFENWISANTNEKYAPLTGKRFLSISECQERLNMIAENEAKRKYAFRKGDLEFVHEIEWEIDDDRKTIGLVPKYDENH